MFPAELFRVAVTVQFGPQWDNYPNDFNISKNRISLISLLISDGYLLKSMGDIMVLYPIITFVSF